MKSSVRFLSIAFVLAGPLACGSPHDRAAVPNDDAASVPETSSDSDAGTDAAMEPEAAPKPDCDRIPSVPVEYDSLPGFTASEDFQFDAQGRWVGVDDNGNIVRITREGQRRLFVPNAGEELAGMRFLPSGDLVFARVDDGTLYRAAQNGASVAVLSGLVYPNGLEVDLGGFVYVAEQTAGRIRKIDPFTGEFTIVARGLENPNGLSFSPDYRTLYCGSFGSGVVYAIAFDAEDNPLTPTIFAQTPESPGAPEPSGPDERSIAACAGARGGDECAFDGDDGLEDGVCFTLGTELYCDAGSSDPWLEACEGRSEGEACTVVWRDGTEPVEGSCADYAGVLYCETQDSWGDPCDGLSEGDACALDGADGSEPIDGTCTSDGGTLLCWPALEDDPYYIACRGLELDSACTVDFDGFVFDGYCADVGVEGGYYCWSDEAFGQRGGLDGMAVDACGYVYVTEYGVGIVWRVSPDGQSVEMLMDPEAAWIPNLHWGTGAGGFERESLYIANRVDGSLYEVPLGIPGKTRGYP